MYDLLQNAFQLLNTGCSKLRAPPSKISERFITMSAIHSRSGLCLVSSRTHGLDRDSLLTRRALLISDIHSSELEILLNMSAGDAPTAITVRLEPYKREFLIVLACLL